MPILKDKYRDKYKPPRIKYCPRCGSTTHRQRFDKEGDWTYFACDVCEFWVGEEVTVKELSDG